MRNFRRIFNIYATCKDSKGTITHIEVDNIDNKKPNILEEIITTINRIKCGIKYQTIDGLEIDIVYDNPKYIRSHKDNKTTNNLENLPKSNLFIRK